MSADNKQEAEKVRRLRSRIVQTLNGDPAASPLGGAHRLGAPYSSHRAPQRVNLSPSHAEALLGSYFSILRLRLPLVPDVQASKMLMCEHSFSETYLAPASLSTTAHSASVTGWTERR